MYCIIITSTKGTELNAQRRKLIEAARMKLEDAKNDIEQARDDEQEYFDNMPESMQSGEKGSRAETLPS
jgi:hypothetical protein